MIKYYLLVVWGDTEPELLGPFESETERDDEAKHIRSESDDDGVYPMDVKDGEPEVFAYSGGFFM